MRRLTGHKGEISCIDVTSDALVSASGKEIRLWDLRTDRAVKCIVSSQIQEDISAITLSKSIDGFENNLASQLEAISLNDLKPAANSVISESGFYIYCCTGKSVLVFDTRTDSMLIRDSIYEYSSISKEDINSISISESKQSIAISDDAGDITLIETRDIGKSDSTLGVNNMSSMFNNYNVKSLTRFHSSIAGCVSFRPKNENDLEVNQVISGGFDCKVCVSDCLNGRTQSFFDFSTHNLANPSQNTQMLNPPFVMSVGFSMKNNVLLCALGDGSVKLMNPNDLSKGPFNNIQEAHNGMITSMHSSGNYNSFVTGGIDRSVKVWKMSLNNSQNNTNKKNKKNKSNNLFRYTDLSCEKMLSIDHGDKINCVKAFWNENEDIGKVVVTDCFAKDIFLYSL